MKRAWLVLLAACGGPSASTEPGAPDAGESSGSVTVVVTERGAPVAGLPVFFHGASGAAAEAVTSETGSCGHDLADGFVTVLLPKARYGTDQLSTFAGVRTGDVLHLDLAAPGPKRTQLAVTVNPDTAAGPMQLYTTCGGEEPFGIVPGVATTLALECTNARIDLLVVRIDPDTGAPLTSQFLGGVGVEAGAVSFTGAFTPVTEVPVAYLNPNSYAYVSAVQRVMTMQGTLFESFDGGAPGDLHSVLRPVVPNAKLLVAATGYPLPDQHDEQVVYAVQDMASGLEVDLASRLPSYANTGAFSGGKLVWSETPGTAAPNLVRGRVHVYRDDIPQGATFSWQIVAPRGAASEVAFPVLAAPFDVRDTDIITVEELTNIKLPGSDYNQARPNGFADVSTFAPSTVGDTLIVARRFVAE